ncbi:MAG: hypothetical protein FJ119_12770 [Deltaproteobacteria bacterium]|nr:hypothetical protein [Deltaproteobacteria bacterium]
MQQFVAVMAGELLNEPQVCADSHNRHANTVFDGGLALSARSHLFISVSADTRLVAQPSTVLR